MYIFIVKRLLITIPIFIVISLILFTLINLAPGGPEAVFMGENISREAAANIRANLNLDKPLPVQYYNWAKAIIRGDLGHSLQTGESIWSLISTNLVNTLILTFSAFILALITAIPLGVLSALKENSIFDRIVSFLSFIGISFPPFWLGILVIMLFSYQLRLFPASGMSVYGLENNILNRLHHLILPAFTLAVVNTATFIRFTRSAVLETLNENYIKTARAKGLNENIIIYKHALRNSLISIITIVGFTIPSLISGSVVIETIFAWPGLGRMAVNAVFQRDYPLIMGINMIVAVITVFSNLGIDIIYTIIDPNITFD